MLAFRYHCLHDRSRKRRCAGIALDLAQVTLEDGPGGALAELGLEDGGERKAPPGPPRSGAA